MTTALALARRGLGRVWPNPAVGCVLVREDLDGRVVGRGWTQPGGRPHAETEAIGQAGGLARGATAYVTLEPCNHVGVTPPCAIALIEAGVTHVVIATLDPDPRTAGAGLQRLSDAGVNVTTDVLGDEARALNIGFIAKITRHRPTFSWKTATSMDGRIATQSGDSKWITGEKSRQGGHLLRAQYDAIMIGSETALVDDPSLTCRLPAMENRSPVRIVLDSRLRIPVSSQLAKSAKTITTLIYTLDADSHRRSGLGAAGITVITADANDDSKISLSYVSKDLAERGITRVLIEGGGTLAASFMKADLIDRVYWFRAPKLIGSEGRPALGGTDILRLDQSPAFTRRSNYGMGADIVEVLDRDRGE